MGEVRAVIPGIVFGLAANEAGNVFAQVFREFDDNIVMSFDNDGNSYWEVELGRSSLDGIRVAGDGVIWAASDTSLLQIGPDGERLGKIVINLHEGEKIGSFLVTPDSVFVGLNHTAREGPFARLIKLDHSGSEDWAVSLPAFRPEKEAQFVTVDPESGQLPGAVESGFNMGRTAEAVCLRGESLLVRCMEGDGDLSLYFCLDANSGALNWSLGHTGIGYFGATDSGFCVSYAGYGGIGTLLIDEDGSTRATWPLFGQFIVTVDGTLVLAEDLNREAACRLVWLLPDGELTAASDLPGGRVLRRNTHPVVDQSGAVAIFRENSILSINAGLAISTLWSGIHSERTITPRAMLLLSGGRIVLPLDRELLFVDTQLDELANSVWPCYLGNAQANPVVASVAG